MTSDTKKVGRFATAFDRNKDIATGRSLEVLLLFTIAVMVLVEFPFLFIPFLNRFGIPFSLVLMGLWSIKLIQTCEALSKWHILTFINIGALSVLSAAPFKHIRPVLAGLVVSVVILHGGSLLYTISFWPPSTTDLQRGLYGSLTVVTFVSILISILFVSAAFKAWPSSWSFNYTMATFIYFASASWIGSKVTGSRGKSCNDAVFSCPSGQQDRRRQACAGASIPLMINAIPSILSILFVASTSYEKESINNMAVAVFFFSVTYLLGTQAFILHVVSRSPVHFYVQTNGSVLVETVSKTYVYGEVVGAHLGPVGKPPRETETSHVYCTELNKQIVVVELTEGRSLYVNVQYPLEFVNAIESALANSDVLDQETSALTKQELQSDHEDVAMSCCFLTESTKPLNIG